MLRIDYARAASEVEALLRHGPSTSACGLRSGERHKRLPFSDREKVARSAGRKLLLHFRHFRHPWRSDEGRSCIIADETKKPFALSPSASSGLTTLAQRAKSKRSVNRPDSSARRSDEEMQRNDGLAREPASR